MKDTMIDNLKEIAGILISLITVFGGLLAYYVQRKKDRDEAIIKAAEIEADAKESDAKADQIHTETTKILVGVATDNAKNLIEQYRLLSEESIASAKACKKKMDEIMICLDEVRLANSEIKAMNNDLKIQNLEVKRQNEQLICTNEQLIRTNEQLHSEIKELREIINSLSEQLEEVGITPKLNRKKDKELMEGEG